MQSGMSRVNSVFVKFWRQSRREAGHNGPGREACPFCWIERGLEIYKASGHALKGRRNPYSGTIVYYMRRCLSPALHTLDASDEAARGVRNELILVPSQKART